MSASPQRWDASTVEGLGKLSSDLAAIDISRRETIGQEIVQAVAQRLNVDRVSLLLIAATEQKVIRAFSHGFCLPEEEWNCQGSVVQKVLHDAKPLLVYDIRETSAFDAPRAHSYKTDSVAILPVLQRGRPLAVLCISNLSSHQLLQIENSSDALALLGGQLAQLCSLLIDTGESAAVDASDELALLAALMDKLERSMDARGAFAIFCELVGTYFPIDALTVIHDRIREPQQGIVCIQRATHISEIEAPFAELARQWQRRNKRSTLLTLDEAVVHGAELLERETECTAAQRLGEREIFPIFIDNDLFALVSLHAPPEVFRDKRKLRVFSVLSQHLMLHVKKSLLLEQNQDMQTIDTLTGLYSERHFYQMMEREFDRTARYNVPLNLLIIDVDHFRDVNETYGFQTGDQLLQEISRIIMENVRNTDLASRYGGERFIALLPETHFKNGEILANRLRRFVENTSFFIPSTNVFIKATVSIGMSSYLDHRPASLAQFIEFADTALYFAKRSGRNRVTGYGYVLNLMMGDTEHQG